MTISVTIDNKKIEARADETILQAAERAGIYIPHLCSRPGLPPAEDLQPSENGIYRAGELITNDNPEPYQGCNLCIVEIDGQAGMHRSCVTIATKGMVVKTNTPELKSKRQEHLISILKDHPHVCLTCAQKEGCSRTQCSANVPDNEKCCIQLGNCELEKLADYIGIHPETPKYVPQDLPKDDSEPLFIRDYNYCIGCLRCVRACTKLSGADILGFVNKDGKVLVGLKNGATYSEADCRFCGLCVEVCPTGALMDREPKTGEMRKWLVPCRSTCPAGIDVPRYIDLIANGKPADACAVIREKVPFPGVLGRVCFHPCEAVCRRNELNEPMAICALKRFAADNDNDQWRDRATQNASKYTTVKTGKTAAVIGGGPSGLTAAYYLQRKGHDVTIFEAEEQLGGMLAWGIPKYRLPEAVQKQEIQDILATGIEVKTNTKVGQDISLDEIRNKFDVVFIAVGAGDSRKIDIEGIDLDGVLWGMDILKAVGLGNEIDIGERVVVVGGGNVAVDVAMTVHREGAGEVQLACLESREEMPAFEWELEEALAESVKLNTSWGPKRIIGNTEGKVTGIELKRCTAVFDDQGNFAPQFNEKETMTIDADTIILAIGQASDLNFIPDDIGLTIHRGMIKVNEDTHEAGTGVYAGGDVTFQPGSVIDAIAAGRRAAKAIDEYLGGDGVIDEELLTKQPVEGSKPLAGFVKLPRTQSPTRDPNERQNYEELDPGFNNETAINEAHRCLHCNLRLELPDVVLPPEDVIAFTNENVATLPDNLEGVFKLLDADKNILVIQGTADIKAGLMERLESAEKSKFFKFEEDKMFSKRESEEIQVYLQKHGQMPPGDGEGGADDLDDLF